MFFNRKQTFSYVRSLSPRFKIYVSLIVFQRWPQFLSHVTAGLSGKLNLYLVYNYVPALFSSFSDTATSFSASTLEGFSRFCSGKFDFPSPGLGDLAARFAAVRWILLGPIFFSMESFNDQPLDTVPKYLRTFINEYCNFRLHKKCLTEFSFRTFHAMSNCKKPSNKPYNWWHGPRWSKQNESESATVAASHLANRKFDLRDIIWILPGNVFPGHHRSTLKF